MWQRREEDEATASAVPFAMHRQEINKQTNFPNAAELVLNILISVKVVDIGSHFCS